MDSGLCLRDVAISKDGKNLLEVDHNIRAGEVLTVMGPSGSGKSTLLSFITGSMDRSFRAEGTVLLNGHDVTLLAPQERKIGILFQDDLLFPHLSVASNLAFGLSKGGSKKERCEKIENALEEVGLEGFRDRDPATLSGGQKVRVALMRMLLSDPHALLLDEPFSKLDAALRAQVRELVFAKATARNLPVLMVTHDRTDADAAAGKIILLT